MQEARYLARHAQSAATPLPASSLVHSRRQDQDSKAYPDNEAILQVNVGG